MQSHIRVKKIFGVLLENKSTKFYKQTTTTLKLKAMKKLRIAVLALVTLTFALTSCQKDENTPGKEASDVDKNSTFAEQSFKDLGNITDKAMNDGAGMMKSGQTFKQSENTCMTLTLDLSAIPYVLTIDFGQTNCLCEDGKYRRGKIFVSYTPGFGDSLTSLVTTLEDYFVDDNQIIGTRTVVHNGLNQAGQPNWDETVDGSIILANNQGTITYQSAHHFVQTEGIATLFVVEDNVYEITGYASGTTVTGQNFSNIITTALVYKPTCNWFVSGVIEITPAGEPLRIIDFGNGECDNLATVYVGGYTINLILP